MSGVYEIDGIAPQIADDGSAWIGDGAIVIGDVVIGKNVGIWFHAVLRGDNERITIGENTNLQEAVICHTDMGFPLHVGSGCTIGHRALLHGCTIGDNSLIGMGAMVMNGAKIGKNCLIGANALVTEGKEIPDNSLVVGAPGKVIRELDAQEIASLRASAQHYVHQMNRARNMVPLARDL